MGFDDLNEDANFMQKLTFFINNVMSPQVGIPGLSRTQVS